MNESTGNLWSERRRSIRLVALDFDGVLTDNTVWVLDNGIEAVRCYRGDGVGLQKLKAAGITAVIISAEINQVVRVRARKLGLPVYGGVEDKLTCLKRLTNDMGIGLEAVAYIGNDEPDRACLEVVGLPVVVGDAEIEVPDAMRLYRHGGRGAVREFCDWLVANESV